MRRTGGLVAALLVVAAVGVSAPSASAGANPWPHTATSGFATPAGDGFWIAYADGSVSSVGTAHNYGNAAGLHLNGPIQAGAGNATGTGYWLVGYDGGVFSYGRAGFFGSMGAHRLNQPVFSMTSTKSGNGYWLVARDGGIFAFGDARFYGSTGNLQLSQPITGITRSPSGHGYRMVAKDGGVFSFGDVPFYGSLPGLGLHVADVVGMAPTPSNRGYWVVRRTGNVYAFGDAQKFGNYTPSPCDRVTGVFSNPAAQGYRIMTASGATIPFGQAPAGSAITGRQRWCYAQTTCATALDTASDYQTVLNTRGPLWDGGDGALPVDLLDGRHLWLFGDTFSGPTDAKKILPGARMVRNTVAVEQSRCLEFRLGGVSDINDYLPAPAPGQWYWPLTGVVDKTAGVVRLAAWRMKPAPGPVGFQWAIMRVDLVTLDLQSLAFRSAVPMPAGGGLQWGESILEDPDYVYIYARVNTTSHYVARTSIAHLSDGLWEYYDGAEWTASATQAQPMQFFTTGALPDTPPAAGLTVARDGTGYLASAQRCDILCNEIAAWYAPSAAGPWTAVNDDGGRVATTTAPQGLITYGGHLVASTSGFLAVWSVNGAPTLVGADKFLYGPRVVATENLPPPDVLAAR